MSRTCHRVVPGLWGRHASALILATSAWIAAPHQAAASPWTLPKDELVLGMGYELQLADQEYLRDGTRQAYPLSGAFQASTLSLDARYGFTDRFEGALRLTSKQVSYTSQPLLLELPPAPDSLPQTRASIQDFSQGRAGLADMYLAGRYNVRRGLWVAAVELQAKVPMGYQAPSGLNVTLGDGQVDVQPSLLWGAYLPATSSFARADVGYALRLGGPGHQLVGGLRVGQLFGSHVIVFGGLDLVQTIFDGERFGDNYVIRDPTVTAQTIRPEDIRVEPLSLDRDMRRAEAGVILRLGAVELQLGYSHILSGANIGALHAVRVTTVVALPQLTSPP